MSAEKRKAEDDWIEATVIDGTERRGAYLATFSGVIPPTTTTFREFKRKRTNEQGTMDVILQGETERIEYEGRTKGKENEDNCQYPLASSWLIIDMQLGFSIKKRELLKFCQPR